jgi:formylglycine-generating enzyme
MTARGSSARPGECYKGFVMYKRLFFIAFIVAVLSGCSNPVQLTVYHQWPFDGTEAKRRQEETAKTLGWPVEKEIDLGGGVKMKMVLIPAGEFVMGSPETEVGHSEDGGPQAKVVFKKPFYMGATDITKDQFAVFVRDTGYTTYAEKSVAADWGDYLLCFSPEGIRALIPQNKNLNWKSPGFEQAGDHPVVNVSLDDAKAFCAWLGKKEGREYRLPTEAEWEYACRAGTATPFNTGETISTDQANYYGEDAYGRGSERETRKRTTPVRNFPPNAWGLYDMHGNVMQWCEHPFSKGNYIDGPAADPTGPAYGNILVWRGSNFLEGSLSCRSANRTGFIFLAHNCLGFRVVMVAAGAKAS